MQIGLRGAPVDVPFDEICFNELRVTSGFAEHAGLGGALELLAAGRVALEPLIAAHRLADWRASFAASRAAAGVKLVLVP